ncbi:hypothetical protein D3C75_768510 [compost metagenome]
MSLSAHQLPELLLPEKPLDFPPMLPDEEDDLLDDDDEDDDDDLLDDDELPVEDDPEDDEVPDDELDFVAVSAGLLADDDWLVVVSAGLLADDDWPVVDLVPDPAAVPEAPEVPPELPEFEVVPEEVPDLDAVALLMLPDLVLNEPLDTLVLGFTLLPGTCLFWNVPAE